MGRFNWLGLLCLASIAGAVESTTVLVHLEKQFDLSSWPRTRSISHLAETLGAFTEKEFQAEFPAFAEDTVGIDSIQPVWIAGSVLITGRREIIEKKLSHARERSLLRALPIDNPVSISHAPLNVSSAVAWGVQRIEAPAVWQSGIRGKAITVAVIDSGVNTAHPDLLGNIWTNQGETGVDSNGQDRSTNGRDDDGNGYADDLHGWNFEEDSPDISDPKGHGSAAAGIIAGTGREGIPTGVAPEASVMVLRACCNLGGEVAETAIWRAMEYALRNGARVISMSVTMRPFSKPNWASWRRASEVLNAAGIVHVNSAGNRGAGNEPFNIGAPASNPPAWFHPEQISGTPSSMITVGATDRDDEPRAYSSFGPVSWEHVASYLDFPYEKGQKPGLIKPDLCAPSEVPSLSPDSDGYVANFGGTSSATPHVAGVVALLLSARPTLSVAEITEALQMTAVPSGTPFNNRCGAGRVNARAALNYLSNFK